MALNDLLVQIKNTILGVKSSQIDNAIDASLDKISKYSSNSNSNKFIEGFKNILQTADMSSSGMIKALEGNVSPQVQNFDQSGRIGRYQEYDSVCAKIPYCQRALETWVDHIVSPDDILKTTLEIMTDSGVVNKQDSTETVKSRVNELIRHFRLEEKTKNIVRTTLKKGDNFLELVKTEGGKNALVVLKEGKDQYVDSGYKDVFSKSYNYQDGDDKKKVKLVVEASSLIQLGGPFAGMGTIISSPNYPNLMKNQADISGMPEWSKDTSGSKGDTHDAEFKSKFDDEDKELDIEPLDESRVRLSNLSLVIHDPKYVIKLETQRYRVCLGYLVFPKTDVTQLMTGGVTNSVESLCADFLKDIKTKLSLDVKNDELKVNNDIKQVLLTHLSKISKNEDLKIRYVRPELMQHFKIGSNKFDPYGESIFDSVLFQCRLYIALETALITKKINAASDKRFVNIEIGLPRDAANIVERMKEALTKKKISVGSMGNIDTIPSQISTFESIYLPQKDGKKFVEIDHQQWGGDSSNDADQLKTIRDNIVGNLGVPVPYLGIEENASNRSILTTESINFCRSVISRQQELSIPLKEFFYKAYMLVWGKQEADLLDNIKITFQQPKISPFEHQNEFLENTSRVIESLSGLGISKDYLKRKFMPYINWDEVDKYTAGDKLDMETGDAAQDDGMGGMGGGLGGMGGMGGMGGGMM